MAEHRTLPTLYSFRRCPYAMRARLALSASQQKCHLREIVLRAKPESMIELSPKATVPVLHLLDDTVLEESLDIMLWSLTENDPEKWLSPEIGTLDEMKALIEEADGPFKYNLDRYKYAIRYEEGTDPVHHRTEGTEFLKKLEMVNFMLSGRDSHRGPWVRQLGSFKNCSHADEMP